MKWSEVHVGMVLEVRDNENIPADLLCLHCSHGDNVCFIKTVNLDGDRLAVSLPIFPRLLCMLPTFPEDLAWQPEKACAFFTARHHSIMWTQLSKPITWRCSC